MRRESYRGRHDQATLGETFLTITIHGDPISGNCLKVKWTARRLSIAFRWVDVDVLAGGTRTPAFLRLNPSGQVPVIILDDGRTLAQSNAIIVHLAEGSTLIPGDDFERARMFEWLFWEQYSHEPYIAVARFQMKYLGRLKAELDPKLQERGTAALERMEGALGASTFLVGEALTLADIALVAYTRAAGDGGFDLDRYPAVTAWIARVEAAVPILDPR